MLDLLITNATLPDGRTGMSIAVEGGRIAEVTEGLVAPADRSGGRAPVGMVRRSLALLTRFGQQI